MVDESDLGYTFPLCTSGTAEGRVADAAGYLSETKVAAEALFDILRTYRKEKVRALVDLFNSPGSSMAEARTKISTVEAHRFARETIAGSILQMAYHAIDRYVVVTAKPESVVEFEQQINDCAAHPLPGKSTRLKKPFTYPANFCTGRQIGGMPIGLIIFAGRNQYNHAHEKRLQPRTELVFNYLHMLHPELPSGLSFNIYDGWGYYAYSIICALGWVDAEEDGIKLTAYQRYIRDMNEILLVDQEGEK